MIAASAALTPSTRRPVPLVRRHDLVEQHIACQGQGYWVIKDPVALTYFQLQPEQYCVLGLLDGERNLEDIREELVERFPYARPTLADIQSTVVDLHGKRLARGSRYGQGISLFHSGRRQRRQKLWGALRSILYLRLPGWDPEQTLRRLYPFVRWMFQPWAVLLTALLVGSALLLLAVQFDSFQERLPEFQQFFGWPNLVYMWLTLAGTKIIHELGHGIACRHYGGECHQIGVIFLVFSPTLYCDVSDSWMLPNKWQRIVIGGAGMYIESIVSSLALFGWWFTQPGLLNHLLLNVFFVSAVTTVIFNLNPLMKFDGYYMLSDFLEIPNLTRKSQRLLQEAFAWNCLGIRPHPDPFMPAEGRFWFATYAAASAIYRWIILFGITTFLYVVLKPYDLQSLGVAMACFSVFGIVFSLVQGVVRTLRAPRQEPLSRPKMAFSGAIALALLLAALLIPIPWRFEAAFYIEPRSVQHVYAVVPGELREAHVRAGDAVAAAAPLFDLADIEKETRRLELATQLRTQEVELDAQLAARDGVGAALARERVAMTREIVADYERQLAQLRVVAPIAGTIVAPPRLPEPKLTHPRTELGTWHGTPLDPANRGCLLEAGTHLVSIAPEGRFQAVLLVDQSDRGDIEEQRTLDIKFDHLPMRTFEAVVREISERHLEFAPEALSNKLGGELPTVTDPRGRERLTSHAYQVLLDFTEGDEALLMSGLRGRARCSVGHRTLAGWIWRAVRRTFHFRM